MNSDILQKMPSGFPSDDVGRVQPPSLAEVFSSNKRQNAQSMANDYLSRLARTVSIDQSAAAIVNRFAADNQWSCQSEPQLLPRTKADSSRAWTGEYGAIGAHTISGSMYGYAITLQILYAPTGSTVTVNNKETINHRRYGVVRVKLGEIFPQMVLDSNKNDKHIISSILGSYKTDQRLSLEGDFDEYFDYYAPKGLQINALTVLSPNFMQIIKESASNIDVEFYGDEFVLITQSPFYSPVFMNTLESALSDQLTYLKRLEKSWNYQPKELPFDTLERSFVSGSFLKIGPLRVSTGLLILAGVVAWFAVIGVILVVAS